MNRDLAKIMLEGQEKTLEAMKLMEKQVAGTITEAESTRLAMLNGNLLALVGQAKDAGFNYEDVIAQTRAVAEAPEVEVGAEYDGYDDSEDDEPDYDYEDEDEGAGYLGGFRW